jgi:hypothetical protein
MINISAQDWLEFEKALAAAIEIERDDLETVGNIEFTRGRISMCHDLLNLRDEANIALGELI